MRYVLESLRLLLRPLKVDDAEAVFNGWANDKEVTKYLTWNPHPNVELTRQLLEHWESQYNEPQTIRFGIVYKPDKKLVGTIDVVRYLDPDTPEIGYCLSRAYWGQGIMPEAVELVTGLLKELGFRHLVIRAEQENHQSIRVIEKSGFIPYKIEEEESRKIVGKRISVIYYEKELQ
ncbi:MAG: GNAT family N-acetyltransferase [Bacilli bacterium]|nr:GNAT family N-acetyltransferase [Bacilli bacterium]